MARARRESRSQSNGLASDNTALLSVVQENLRLMAELRTTARSNRNGGPLGGQASCPEDIYRLVGPEMANLVQEQVQVILLDTKRHVLDVVMVYQGNITPPSCGPPNCCGMRSSPTHRHWCSRTTTRRATRSRARRTSA